MESIYCIYTDKDIESCDSSPEHIIPLSLGGCNEFTIPVDTIRNCELGSSIDGKMANDVVISLIRSRNDYKGHTKRKVVPKLVNSKITETQTPVQVHFNKNGVEVFNPIENRKLSKEEIETVSFESLFQIDKDIRMRFTAKVVLAAGYFIYGDLFRKYADHSSLRKLMNLNPSQDKNTFKDIPLRVVDKFHPIPEKDKGLAATIELMCKRMGGSCVIFLREQESFIASVGIGGEFIGSIQFKAEMSKIPEDENFRLGHVVCIQNKKLRADAVYTILEKLEACL